MKDRSKLNLVVDALLLACLAAIAAIGWLLAQVLPPGRELHAIHGRGVRLTWLGWDRHDWGALHQALAWTLCGLIALHLALHYKQILCLAERLVKGSRARIAVAGAFAALCALPVALALLAVPEVGQPGSGRHRAGLARADADRRPGPAGRAERGPRGGRQQPVRPAMTLGQAAERGGVRTAELAACLGLPESTAGGRRLGEIRRELGVPMGELRTSVRGCTLGGSDRRRD